MDPFAEPVRAEGRGLEKNMRRIAKKWRSVAGRPILSNANKTGIRKLFFSHAVWKKKVEDFRNMRKKEKIAPVRG